MAANTKEARPRTPVKPTRAMVREAKDEVARTRKLLRRHKKRLGDAARAELEEAVAAMKAAIKTKEPAAFAVARERLNERVEKRLGFVKRRPNLEFALSLGKTLAVVLVLRFGVVEPYKIPSGSMIPTLMIGDHLFINKLSYGVRIPGFNKLVAHWGGYERGDVVVFVTPLDRELPFYKQRDFIKRIVGLPGDTIEVIDEVVHINGQPQPRVRVEDHFAFYDRTGDDGDWFQTMAQLYTETLSTGDGGTTSHAVLRDPMFPHMSMEGPFKVPPGHLFMMGDNRDKSADSRAGGWFVPFANVKGRALFIWLSLGEPGFIRFDRMFTRVQ